MIRVTAELIPHGDEKHPRRRILGRLDIANDASGSEDAGNYQGTLHAEYTTGGGRKGRVEQFIRRRQSIWSLVGAFLKLFGHTGQSPKLMRKGANNGGAVERVHTSE